MEITHLSDEVGVGDAGAEHRVEPLHRDDLEHKQHRGRLARRLERMGGQAVGGGGGEEPAYGEGGHRLLQLRVREVCGRALRPQHELAGDWSRGG